MISANGGLPAHRYTPQVTHRWPQRSEPASPGNEPSLRLWPASAAAFWFNTNGSLYAVYSNPGLLALITQSLKVNLAVSATVNIVRNSVKMTRRWNAVTMKQAHTCLATVACALVKNGKVGHVIMTICNCY